MAKFDVAARITISTTIEPQGNIDDPYLDGIEEFEVDAFSGYGSDIEESTEVRFVYTFDGDETEAGEEAQSELSNHLSYTGDDIEWEITDVEILSCERQEMSIEDAVSTLRTFIDSREDAFREHHPLVFEAIEKVLQQF